MTPRAPSAAATGATPPSRSTPRSTTSSAARSPRTSPLRSPTPPISCIRAPRRRPTRRAARRCSTSTARAPSPPPPRTRRPTAPFRRQWDNDPMTPQTAETPDPFDLDFDAETEFASTPDAAGPPRAADPFAGLPAPRALSEDDAVPASSPAPNPIAEMLASAEAALGEHTVPRITIHAFWARAEMGELIHKASTDRRMERAKTVVHQGGLAEAVGFYQNQPTPSLLLVESL